MEDKFDWPERPDIRKRPSAAAPTAEPLATQGKATEGEGKRENGKEKRDKVEKGKRDLKKVGMAATLVAGTALAAAAGLAKFQASSQGADKTVEPVRIESFEMRVNFNQIKERFSHEFFPNLRGREFANALQTVGQMVEVVRSNPSYEQMLTVVKKHEAEIRQEAAKNNFPEDLALGIVFVENGGGEDLTSPSGAVGVAQFLPEVAREFGLQVDEERDERKDPEKSIVVMTRKLAADTKLFAGKADFAVWAYHAGAGNVYKALRIHYRQLTDVDLGDITEMSEEKAAELKETFGVLIKQDGLNVHTVLQNPAVQNELLTRLEDETELYPYKVVAAAALFEAEKGQIPID